MAQNRRIIVLIPPKGARIRSIRIPASLLVIVFLVLLAGFAGYLIPFNHLTLDVTEQNQLRNLSGQNAKLIQRIRAIRQSFFVLRARTKHLAQQSDSLARPLALEPQRLIPDHSERDRSATKGQLLVRIAQEESLLVRFMETHGSDTAFFERVPIIKPISGYTVVTNRFGKVVDAFTGTRKQHNGIDFAAKRGTPVMATASGTVTKSENHPFWGLRVFVDHEQGYSTVYAHLESASVVPGKKLRRGDQIGTVGSSGLSTGPHLHYEIHRGGVPVDPELYFFPEPPVMVASLDP